MSPISEMTSPEINPEDAVHIPKSPASVAEPPSGQDTVRDQIAESALLCEEIEGQFDKNPPPELETLLKLHRVLILKFSLEANASQDLLRLVRDLMKPVMDWAQLQEKRKLRELAERKYHDQAEALKAAQAKEKQAGDAAALTPDTLSQIERELQLL